ncbi:MAG: hypothetical protein U5K70_05185 [Halodesulfurarchaeum sp.]|nr:hypothetical protein [Halodesulfurarchaeum sp.]
MGRARVAGEGGLEIQGSPASGARGTMVDLVHQFFEDEWDEPA